jgi:HK97 family phage major capsid protein
MIRVAKRKLDQTLIRSIGASYEPQGLLYMAPDANKNDMTGTPTLTTVTADLSDAVRRVEEANIDVAGAGWLIAPRTKQYLSTLRGTDIYAFRDEMSQGRLLGFPFISTTNIPTNLGGGTDNTEIYFCHFPTMLFALGEDFRVEAFRGGAYHNGSSVISGIAQDQTVVSLMMACDFASLYQGDNISVIEAFDADA